MSVKKLETLGQIHSVLQSTKLEGPEGQIKAGSATGSAQIGKFGGRKFVSKLGKETITFTMKDILKQLDSIVRVNPPFKKTDAQVLNNILIDLKDLDAHGYKLLNEEKNIIQKILTAVRGFIGNVGFHKKEIISNLEDLSAKNIKNAEKIKYDLENLIPQFGIGSIKEWGLEDQDKTTIDNISKNMESIKEELNEINRKNLKSDENAMPPKIDIKKSLIEDKVATTQFLRDFKHRTKLDMKKYALKLDTTGMVTIQFRKKT